jgi:hypothetical protein
MNIFVLDEDPITAAQMHCDKHVPKMCVEAAQMLASALRRHGATDEDMPLTKAGTPYKGGYAHHPCTVWAGDTYPNFQWLVVHGIGLCSEYRKRFGKDHACYKPILRMESLGRHLILKPSDDIIEHITGGELTPFALAMPDEYRDDDAVKAYQAYYHSKQFAKWEKGTPAPDWWQGVEVKA